MNFTINFLQKNKNRIKVMILILFCFNYTLTKAQLSRSDYKGSWNAKFSAGKMDKLNYQNGSIGGERYIGENFGLNYNFDIVRLSDKRFMVHGSAGMLVGPPLALFGLLAFNSNDDINGFVGGVALIGGILLTIMPEGITYHFKTNSNMDFAVYANVLGVDYVNNKIRYTATGGMKVEYFRNQKYHSFGFLETRKTVNENLSFGIGIGMGYRVLDN